MKLPAHFVPHGGGPWPWVNVGLPRAEHEAMATYLQGVAAGLEPRAILCVTAHWEAPVATVSSAVAPGMLYDYYGFPAESYRIQWPAPGSPELARRVRELLTGAGIASAEDPSRGFDHGTFVPLKLAFPAAQVPCVQLSLVQGLDPARHLALGRALAPLRDEGVLIVGSGMSYHNLRKFFDGSGVDDSRAFDAWLQASVLGPDRDARLARWTEAPAARAVHPREEHLLPLHVVAGAAGDDPARLSWSGTVMGLSVSGFAFG